MATVSLRLDQAYTGSPFIWGSSQNALLMQFVSQAAPFVVTNQSSQAQYTMDVLGRLQQITFSNGTTVTYSYDAMGNRTQVVSACGSSGC